MDALSRPAHRRAVLDWIAERYRLQKSDLFFGCGKSLFNAVCEFGLEGIIPKRLDDPYEPEKTKWWKILNPSYLQKEGRSELFEAWQVFSRRSGIGPN